MNACHEIFLFEMIVYYINNLTISFSSRYKQIIIICKSIYKIIEKQIVFTYFISEKQKVFTYLYLSFRMLFFNFIVKKICFFSKNILHNL